jgi:hypothetical protein
MKALLKACSIAALVTFSMAAYAENAAKKPKWCRRHKWE